MIKYNEFEKELAKANNVIEEKGYDHKTVDVMVTKSSGDTLVYFMINNEEIVYYFKI